MRKIPKNPPRADKHGADLLISFLLRKVRVPTVIALECGDLLRRFYHIFDFNDTVLRIAVSVGGKDECKVKTAGRG